MAAAAIAHAQSGAPLPDRTPPPRWQRVTAADGKYSFSMPAKPEHTTNLLKAKNGRPVLYSSYYVDFGSSAYLVSTSDYDSETIISLDGAIDGVLSTWEKPRIVSRKRTTLYGYPAQVVDFASRNSRVVTRVFIVGRRLYHLGFVESISEYIPAHSDRFMNSFRLR
jgi:hypothetical protein